MGFSGCKGLLLTEEEKELCSKGKTEHLGGSA